MYILRFVRFDSIKTNLDILKNEYNNNKNLISNKSNFFVFPEKLFKEINDIINTINYLLISKEEIKDEEIKSFYDSLSEKIYLSLGEIKSSSFENTIFNRIKNIMNDITDFVQSTDLKMDKIKNPNNDLSQNMAYNEEYDRINNIHNNFSYLNYSKLEEKNNPNNLSFNESRLSHLGSSMKHDFLNIEQEEDFMIINESLCQKNNINKNNTNNYKNQIIEKIKEQYKL